MKKNQIILIIIGVLILIGLIFGFSYWLGKKSVEVKKEIVAPKFLTSKVIQKWNAVASGKVIEISNRNLTLSSDGEALIIPIIEEATISLLGLAEREREDIQFKDIKVGDNVNIGIEVTPEGKIVGNSVTILK